MKALILAAGEGKRLEPITHTRPKPLIPVLNKPLIDYTLSALKELGVKDIVIVVGHLKDKLINYIRNKWSSLNITFIHQDKPLGTGHAVKVAEKYLNGDFLIIYGDLLLSKELIEKVVKEEGPTICGVYIPSSKKDYGILIYKNGLLEKIIEKPSSYIESDLINAGVYKFSEDIFYYLEKIKKSPRGEYELTDAINLMVQDGIKVKVVKARPNEWFEVGKPWDILNITEELMKATIKTSIIRGEVEDFVKIKGPVIIEEGAVIRSGTYIIGPVIIGRNVTIGPNSYIRPYTVIGDGSRIGNAVEVKSSVLMEHVTALHLTYIGDSIVCENVNFGAGTVTANLRFDEKEVKMTIKGIRVSSGRRKLGAIIGAYVRTGINVSLMPGVKIGAYSWIAPGAIVDKDIPPYTFIRFKVEYYLEDIKERLKEVTYLSQQQS